MRRHHTQTSDMAMDERPPAHVRRGPANSRRGAAVAMFALCLGLAALATGCAQEDVTEWVPADHDGEAKAGQVDGVAAPGQEDAVIVSITWKQNCARCHGLDGHAQTQEGKMNKVPDVTFSKGSDEELMGVIIKGRNKMPAFGKALPPNVVKGLVAHIRKLGGR